MTALLVGATYAVSAGALTGCADDAPAAVTRPITLDLGGLTETDLENGVLVGDKNISSESGNPWAEFIRAAEDQLGAAPTVITFTSVRLSLNETSKAAGSFEEIVTGAARVYVTRTNGELPILIAEAASVSGTVADLPVTATSDDLAPLFGELLGTDFKVRVELVTDREESDEFELDLSVTLSAEAR